MDESNLFLSKGNTHELNPRPPDPQGEVDPGINGEDAMIQGEEEPEMIIEDGSEHEEVGPEMEMEEIMEQGVGPTKPQGEGEPGIEREEDSRGDIRSSMSFRDIVAGEKQEVKLRSKKGRIRKEDMEVKGLKGTFSLSFSARAEELLGAPWKQSVVVKLLGRSIGYNALNSRLHALWKPSGDIQIMDLDNEYYLIKCQLKIDFEEALCNGPWVILGHYLTVQPWTEKFRATEQNCTKVAVWVRLPNLPVQYYDEEVLEMIGNQLGETLKIDTNTTMTQRGKYARLAVRINLEKPLIGSFYLAGEVQRVEYESLPCVCFRCGRVGHSMELCREQREEQGVNNREEEKGMEGGRSKEGDGSVMEEEGSHLGPWMQVQRRNYRQRYSMNVGRNPRRGDKQENKQGESRFSVLSEGMEEVRDEQRETVGGVGPTQRLNKGKEQVRRRANEAGKKDHRKEVNPFEGVVGQRKEGGNGVNSTGVFHFGTREKVAQTTLKIGGRLDGRQKYRGESSGREETKEGERGNETVRQIPLLEGGGKGKPPDIMSIQIDRGRDQQDRLGKRRLNVVVKDREAKSVRPRQDGEIADGTWEEEEVISLVESTFKEKQMEGC